MVDGDYFLLHYQTESLFHHYPLRFLREQMCWESSLMKCGEEIESHNTSPLAAQKLT
jgi:hypothetical protein